MEYKEVIEALERLPVETEYKTIHVASYRLKKYIITVGTPFAKIVINSEDRNVGKIYYEDVGELELYRKLLDAFKDERNVLLEEVAVNSEVSSLLTNLASDLSIRGRMFSLEEASSTNFFIGKFHVNVERHITMYLVRIVSYGGNAERRFFNVNSVISYLEGIEWAVRPNKEE